MAQVVVLDSEPLDSTAKLYRAIRDIAHDSELETCVVLSVLELVKFELLRDLQHEIDAVTTN